MGLGHNMNAAHIASSQVVEKVSRKVGRKQSRKTDASGKQGAKKTKRAARDG